MYDPFHGLLVAQRVAVEHERRLRVVGFALGDVAPHELHQLGIAEPLQFGAFRPSVGRQPRGDPLRRTAQIDRRTRLRQHLHIVAPRGQAAARGDDAGLAGSRHALHHRTFQFAEALLALVTEDVADRRPLHAFDLGVGIDGAHPCTARQFTRQRALAAPHIPHQKDLRRHFGRFFRIRPFRTG